MPDGPLSPLVCTEQWYGNRPCQFAPVTGDTRCEHHWGGPHTQRGRRLSRSLDRFEHKGALNHMKPGASATMRFGAPIEKDPGMALLEEVHRAAGHVAWLEEKVRGLEESELVWGTVMVAQEERSGGQGGDYALVRTENRSTINTWWELYRKEREHLSKVALAALKAGIEERRVRIAERGVDALELALTAALTDLGIDASDERVRAIVGRRLSEAVAADIFGQKDHPSVKVVQGELVSRPPLVREAPVSPFTTSGAAPARDDRNDPTEW